MSEVFSVVLRLGVVLLLVALNGFFVAAEFALVSARRTRLEQLAASGNAAAALGRRMQDDLDRYIAAAQLGITLASLALGWIGESTIAQLIEPGAARPDQRELGGDKEAIQHYQQHHAGQPQRGVEDT